MLTVSKILVPLKVSAKALTDFSVPRISLHHFMNLADFPEEFWNPLPIEAKYDGVFTELSKMWNLNFSWKSKQSMKRNSNYVASLGLCRHVCLDKQLIHHLEPGIACRGRAVEQIHRDLVFVWKTTCSSYNGLQRFQVHKNHICLLHSVILYYESHVDSVPKSSLAHSTEQWSNLAQSYLQVKFLFISKGSE